jgi:DNA-binding transcriptional MerR regulator
VTEPAVEIPDRPLFKAAEVCELARVQPYVLRSWELEFPGLGVAKVPGGPRVYRRVDVEQVLRIRQLVYGEGLTLSGARRRMEEDAGGGASELPTVADLLGDDARRRLSEVKRGLRSLHEMLLATPGAAAAGAPEASGAQEPVIGSSEPDAEIEDEPKAPVPAVVSRAETAAGWPPREAAADRPSKKARR